MAAGRFWIAVFIIISAKNRKFSLSIILDFMYKVELFHLGGRCPECTGDKGSNSKKNELHQQKSRCKSITITFRGRNEINIEFRNGISGCNEMDIEFRNGLSGRNEIDIEFRNGH